MRRRKSLFRKAEGAERRGLLCLLTYTGTEFESSLFQEHIHFLKVHIINGPGKPQRLLFLFTIYKKCPELPIDWLLLLESKWSTTFWSFQRKISGSNGTPEKPPVFPDGIFQAEIRVEAFAVVLR